MKNLNHEETNIKKIIKPYLGYWKWFVFSCIFFIILAFFNIRYATPEYNAQAKIILTGEDNQSNPAGQLIKGMIKGGEVDQNIEDEIEVLTSRRLMKRVIRKLDLNRQFYLQGRIHDTQIFPNSEAPIIVTFIESDSIIDESNFSFTISVTSETTFELSYLGYVIDGIDSEVPQKYFFGKNVSTPIGDMVITPNTDDVLYLREQILMVQIIDVNYLADVYKTKVLITPSGEFSKVLNFSLDDSSILRAETIINTLVDEYNLAGIEEKNVKANNTSEFIDQRIGLIATDLSAVDDEIEQFKTGNKLTDITSEAELYLNSNAQTEQELAASRTEYNMVNYMKSLVSDNTFERIPSNVGLSDVSINTMAANFNQLLDDRDRLLKSSNEKNPIVVNLDQQINNVKNSLRQSLNNLSKTIGLKIRSLENQATRMSSKIYSVPGQVRKSRDIQREQGIKESLYLYLLEKREEATISLGANSPNAKIIDRAYSDGFQVAPNVIVTYLGSIILGFLVPFACIYLMGLFDTKIHNREDLEDILKNEIPILGEIPSLERSDIGLIERNDRSVLSESFRIIRTNFDYLKRREQDSNSKYKNVIFVTSTINGEGKSFVSLNTALTVANTGKKVLLIGADLRNPQIYSAIAAKTSESFTKNSGLSEYLVDSSINIEDGINTHTINDLDIDILLSGSIPPNPAELLMSKRIEELFDKVSEQYDYVIVDTAPSMLVTDTLLISQYAGHTIYLTRANYTEKRILNFAKELHAENKLTNMMLIVNDVKQSNFGYGAKYGYYRAPEKKGFFRRRKNA